MDCSNYRPLTHLLVADKLFAKLRLLSEHVARPGTGMLNPFKRTCRRLRGKVDADMYSDKATYAWFSDAART